MRTKGAKNLTLLQRERVIYLHGYTMLTYAQIGWVIGCSASSVGLIVKKHLAAVA